jgi:hypothetical protein
VNINTLKKNVCTIAVFTTLALSSSVQASKSDQAAPVVEKIAVDSVTQPAVDTEFNWMNNDANSVGFDTESSNGFFKIYPNPVNGYRKVTPKPQIFDASGDQAGV